MLCGSAYECDERNQFGDACRARSYMVAERACCGTGSVRRGNAYLCGIACDQHSATQRALHASEAALTDGGTKEANDEK